MSLPKRPRDINQLAHHLVGVAAGRIEEPPMGPRGRQIGGHARAASMTPEERTAQAKKAAAARWKKKGKQN